MVVDHTLPFLGALTKKVLQKKIRITASLLKKSTDEKQMSFFGLRNRPTTITSPTEPLCVKHHPIHPKAIEPKGKCAIVSASLRHATGASRVKPQNDDSGTSYLRTSQKAQILGEAPVG